MFQRVRRDLDPTAPYAEAERLVLVWDDMRKVDVTTKLTPEPAEWIEWRRLNTVFTDLATSQPVEATVSGGGDPEQVPVALRQE